MLTKMRAQLAVNDYRITTVVEMIVRSKTVPRDSREGDGE